MSYDLDKLERRYEDLTEKERSELRFFWTDIVGFLGETDRDWVRKKDIEEGEGIDDSDFARAYDGFLKVFDPPMSAGDAFAFYEMEHEDIVEFGEEAGLPDVNQGEKLSSPVDEYLENDYGDI